jgi:hypothetical protein
MMQRIPDIALSVLACVAALFLSWPFWRDFAYWPASHTAWSIYFAVGFVLAVFVFYLFMGSLHVLFLHAADERTPASALNDGNDGAASAKREARP